MPLSYGFASSTAHATSIPKKLRSEAFNLAPLSIPEASHDRFKDQKEARTRSSRDSRVLCAMASPSDNPLRASPLLPPASSPVTAFPTKRTISPGVYISKGEGHSVRHSWIVGGRLVEFPFPESQPRDNRYNSQAVDPVSRSGPISIPTSSIRRPSQASSSSSSSSFSNAGFLGGAGASRPLI
ncbi:hypothetical protein BX600DRAFT_494514 [Xylariales sp. PMI_506]|nr:hypothetical protein BX600DRAFT_494514 [Xylariales sp. PMI_506]